MTQQPATPTLTHPTSNFPFAPLAGILLLAFLARCLLAARTDLWLDEACSDLFITDPRGILQALRIDVHPPLYFLILKAWTSLLGDSPLAVRFPSILAGTASVAATVLFARRLGAVPRTLLWTAALVTVVPMQVAHSSEARAYPFLYLFVTLALWSWVNAVESGRWRDWLLHALTVLLGIYTHHLMCPMLATFWIAAMLQRLDRRRWLQMCVTYFLIALLALPSVALLLSQNHATHGEDWVADGWNSHPHLLFLLHSLEALGTTGYIVLGDRSVSSLIYQILGLAASFAALFVLIPRPTLASKSAPLEMRTYMPLLLTAALWPILFLWTYSEFRQPLFVYGRYDIIAQPAILILLSLGLSRLQSLTIHRFGKAAGACLLLAVLLPTAWHSIAEPELQVVNHGPGLFSKRMEVLQSLHRPGDQVIGLDLEYAPLLYAMNQEHLDLPLQSFPADVREHPGWMIGDQQLQSELPKLEAQAVRFFSSKEAPSRIFVALDTRLAVPPVGVPISPRTKLTLFFFDQARKAGYHFNKPSPKVTDDLIRAQLAFLEK
ncbi:MAG TPA: glycosyltransferase family 39 protein [Phycisphaerae bacterium]|nr:glycosyltransferase family 39 protein [Phycisphaerae bacterium]